MPKMHLGSREALTLLWHAEKKTGVNLGVYVMRYDGRKEREEKEYQLVLIPA